MPSPIIFASSLQRIFGFWRERGIGKLDFAPDPNRQITNTLLFHSLDKGYVEFDGNAFLDEVMPDVEVNSNWLLSNEVIANDWGTSAARARIAKQRKQIVGKNTSFINTDFLLELDSEEGRRAIPDRYNRYDDGTANDDDDDDEMDDNEMG